MCILTYSSPIPMDIPIKFIRLLVAFLFFSRWFSNEDGDDICTQMYIYVYMCLYAYVYINTFPPCFHGHTCTVKPRQTDRIHTLSLSHTHTHKHTHTHHYLHKPTTKLLYTHTHSLFLSLTHTHTHTCTHTHTHTGENLLLRRTSWYKMAKMHMTSLVAGLFPQKSH